MARMYTFLRELGAQVDGSNVPAYEPTRICVTRDRREFKSLISLLEIPPQVPTRNAEKNAKKLFVHAQARIPH